MAEKQALHTNCPFVTQPLAGCRVQVITGQTIPQILECCGDRFAECPLYMNRLADGDGLELILKSAFTTNLHQ